jgi:hypothetical protein
MNEVVENFPHPSAIQFGHAFLRSYAECRVALADTAWHETWRSPDRWTALMLSEGASVIAKTAECLKVEYRKREPLRLDAVFCCNKSAHLHLSPPFPVLVAIEHENDPDCFDEEIRKLCLVRCPLKVGITYTLGGPSIDHALERERIRCGIVKWISRMNRIIGEERTTEYAFLVGSEEEKLKELQWYALIFSASDGPGAQQLVPCGSA